MVRPRQTARQPRRGDWRGRQPRQEQSRNYEDARFLSTRALLPREVSHHVRARPPRRSRSHWTARGFGQERRSEHRYDAVRPRANFGAEGAGVRKAGWQPRESARSARGRGGRECRKRPGRGDGRPEKTPAANRGSEHAPRENRVTVEQREKIDAIP